MRKRRLIFPVILMLLVFGSAAIWYTNRYILPSKAKSFIIQTLEKQLGQKVALEKVDYHPFKGIVIENLVIFDKINPQEIALKIEHIHFNCLILPIFKEKKIVIPSIKFNRWQVNLRHSENGLWNIEDVFKIKSAPGPKGNFQILIYKLYLMNGHISIADNYSQPAFAQEIENINAIASFSFPSKINFKLSANTKEKNPTRLILTGGYNLNSKLLSWQSNVNNIHLSKYASYYQNALPFIKILEADIDTSYHGSLDKGQNLILSQDIILNNCSFISEKFSGQGNINASLELKANLKDMKNLKYDGRANILNFTLDNLAPVKTISDLSGTINFNNQAISTQNLKGKIYNTLANLSGEVRGFAHPQANLTLTSDIDLNQIRTALPENLKNKFADVEIKGQGHFQAFFSGYLKEDILSNIKSRLEVKNGQLKTPFLPYALEQINGNLSFVTNKLSFDQGGFSYDKTPYQVNGFISNFNKPDITLSLSSEKLKIEADFSVEEKDIHINAALGKYLNSDFEINGDIFNITQPHLNLYGTIELNLTDLEEMLPFVVKDFWEIKGIALTKVFINGLIAKPKDLEIGLKLNCPSLAIKKIKLEDLALDFRMKDRQANALVNARSYQGNFGTEVTTDLTYENPLYEGKLNLNDLDLKLLMKDLNLEKKNITGHLSGQGKFKGYGTNLETLKGQVWAEILEGNLWEIPLLGDFSNILNMPHLKKVTFKEAHGNFTITNKQAVSKDLVFLSKELALSAQGSLGFDGKIEALISTTFDPEFIKPGSFIGAFVAGIGSIIQYRIYNTISEPKFEKIISPPHIEEGLPSDFIDRFKNILKDIGK